MAEKRQITIEGYTVEEITGIGEAYHYVYDIAENPLTGRQMRITDRTPYSKN